MRKIFTFFYLLMIFSTSAQEVSIVRPAPEYPVEDQTLRSEYEGEYIISFQSDITIAENAEVTVKETIEAYSTGNEIKRGLFRALPMVRNGKDGKEKIFYKIIAVKKDGKHEPYHTETVNGVFNIYIGDKDILLNTGFYTYEITYKTQDQIGHFKGYDEFYWNVNGTDWSFPIKNIQATLTLPSGANILQNYCYTGIHGSTDTNCTTQKLSSTQINFEASDLKAKENLTIAVGFKAGVLKEPSAFMKWIKRNWPSLFLILAGFYLLYFYYDQWDKYGRDPEKPIIIPQFNAPRGLSPGSLGYINEGKFAITQVTANLVDLAIQGFLHIDEVKDELKKTSFSKIFDLQKRNRSKQDLPADQLVLLTRFFGKSENVRIDGTYSTKIKNAVVDFEKSLTKINKVYIENQANTRLFYKALKIIGIVFMSALIMNAIITMNPLAVIIAIFVLIFNGGFVALLLATWKDKKKGLFIGLFLFGVPFLIPVFAYGRYRG